MSARARLLAPLVLASLIAVLASGPSAALAIQASDAVPELVIGSVVSVQPQIAPETGVISTEIQVVESHPGGGTELTSFTMQGGEVDGLGMWSEQFTDVRVGDSVIASVESIGGETAAVSAPVTAASVAGATIAGVESGSAGVAAGYIWDGLHWADSDLPASFYVNSSGMPAGSTTAIAAAAQTWEDEAGSRMDFTYMGTRSTAPGTYDGFNVVGSGNLGANGPLAVCMYWYDPGTSHLLQFDITYNTAYYTFSTSPGSSSYDVQGIGTHELGHTLSLGDMYAAENSNQVMYGLSAAGSTSARVLAWGDIAGIRAIYPAQNGALSGTVTNSAGAPLSGVSVAVPGFGPVLSAANGTYLLSDIGAGTYDVTFSKAGYVSRTLNVSISAGATTVCSTSLSTPPVTTASAAPANALSLWVSSNVTVTLSAASSSGAIAWTRYSINGGPEQLYGAPFALSTQGTTTLTYRSQDGEGNTESARTATVRIDRTPPVTAPAGMRVAYRTGSAESVALVATDPLSGSTSTAWRLGTSGPFATGVSVPVPAAVGTYTLQYYSTDAAGNAESVRTAIISVIGDDTEPVTTSDAVPTYVSSARISLSATDTGSGVASTRWLLDGVAGSGPIVDVAAYGSHTLRFWSLDVVGNAETPTEVTFLVRDVTPPVATAYTGLAHLSATAIQVAAADEAHGSGVASISYRLDGGTTQTVAGSLFTVEPSQGATHTLIYWASDSAGNSSSPATMTRRVDGPTRFIITRIPTPTSAGKTVTLTARAETSTAAGPVLGEPVQLQVRHDDAWSQALPTPAYMAESGAFSFSLSPLRSGVYRVVTAPGSTLPNGESASFVIGVRSAVTRPSRPSSPRAKRRFAISGRVSPALKRSARLEWYRVKGTTKRPYSAKTIPLTSSGKWTVRRSLPRGTWSVRVVYTDPLKVVTHGHYRTFKVR